VLFDLGLRTRVSTTTFQSVSSVVFKTVQKSAALCVD